MGSLLGNSHVLTTKEDECRPVNCTSMKYNSCNCFGQYAVDGDTSSDKHRCLLDEPSPRPVARLLPRFTGGMDGSRNEQPCSQLAFLRPPQFHRSSTSTPRVVSIQRRVC